MIFVLLPLFIKILVLISLFILSLVVFSIVDLKNVQFVFYCTKIVFYSGSMWFLPFLSTVFFMPLIKLGEALIKCFDQG
jgi:hypothetical protein